MNSATGSTPNGLPHDHRWLTAWVLDKNHNVTKDEYHLLFCYKNYQLEKQQQNYDKCNYIFVELSPCFIKA